jgi:XTP/dITP diphosphohydrolase
MEVSVRKIIFATTNEGKLAEIKMILDDLDYEVVSLQEANISVEIDENGASFEENAIIKAKRIMELTNEIALADDSGLEVDAMDRQPGIYSARFLGENTSYDIKNNYILEQLIKVPDEKRTARFVCAIACAFPDGRIVTRQATIEGKIGYEIAGENGFGYDPIFFVPEFGCTTAQLAPELKNMISHRAKALNAMKQEL